MKRNIKITALAIGLLAIGLTGCKKEQFGLTPETAYNSESDIQSLAIQAENETTDITYDENSNELTAVNEGLAPDYLVTGADFDTETTGPNNSNSVHGQSFIRCLKSLKLEDDQVKKIRAAMADYEDCKASAIKRARAIHAKLVAKYKELAEEQAKLLRAGKITKAEYEQRIARLRHAFQKELRELQLKEKLREALKDCHTKFLRQLHGILSEIQWKAFVDCYRK